MKIVMKLIHNKSEIITNETSWKFFFNGAHNS